MAGESPREAQQLSYRYGLALCLMWMSGRICRAHGRFSKSYGGLSCGKYVDMVLRELNLVDGKLSDLAVHQFNSKISQGVVK